MSITITKTDETISVVSEYNANLPVKSKKIGGRWNKDKRSWDYPVEAEDEIRDMYISIYGEYDQKIETVTILCKCNDTYCTYGALQLSSMQVAYAAGRDSGARIDKRVIVVKGGFTSGGSVKNFTTVCKEDTEFKLIKVPESIAKFLVDNPGWCDSISILSSDKKINVEDLKKEKEALLKRIQDIDDIISYEETHDNFSVDESLKDAD